MFSNRRKTILDDFQEVHSPVALLEPEPEIVAIAPVMERAKNVITPFSLDIDSDRVNGEIYRLNRELKSLYGIEAGAVTAINTRLAELTGEQRKARAYTRYKGDKKLLSAEVLTWRKPEPLMHGTVAVPQPEVGLFSLDQAELMLHSQWLDHGEWQPALPRKLTQQYKDVYGALGVLNNMMSFGSAFSIRAAFSGLIPAETKEKIREAQSSAVFSDIRLLAETSWKLQETPQPFYADPIVIGLVDAEMWVIDVFDPTPLEDYIAREFTT